MDEEEDFKLSGHDLMFKFLEEGEQANQTLNEEDISLVHQSFVYKEGYMGGKEVKSHFCQADQEPEYSK